MYYNPQYTWGLLNEAYESIPKEVAENTQNEDNLCIVLWPILSTQWILLGPTAKWNGQSIPSGNLEPQERSTCFIGDKLGVGVDSSYHVWIKLSVRRGIIWGISVHTIHKIEVLFFFSVYIQRGY